MIDYRYNTSVLPLYPSKDYQYHMKEYSDGKTYPVLCPIGHLPTFQWILPSGFNIDSITLNLVSYYDGSTSDIFAQVDANGLTIENHTDYYIIKYDANTALTGAFENEQFYLILSDGVLTYYSDVFQMFDRIDSCICIEWYNPNGLKTHPTGESHISYRDGFKNRFYIEWIMVDNNRSYQNEAVQRLGLNSFLSKFMRGEKSFKTLSHSSIMECLHTIQLHENIYLTYDNIRYKCLEFNLNTQSINKKIEEGTFTFLASYPIHGKDFSKVPVSDTAQSGGSESETG